MCHMYRFSTAAMVRERASVIRYTYIACHIYGPLEPLSSPNCSSYPLQNHRKDTHTGVNALLNPLFLRTVVQQWYGSQVVLPRSC